LKTENTSILDAHGKTMVDILIGVKYLSFFV